MLVETYDPRIPQMWSGHPEIAPGVSGPLDFTGAVATTYLFGEHGGFCFAETAPHEYEGHVMLTTAGRGRWGKLALIEAVGTMLAKGARRIWCRAERPDVAAFAAAGGFRSAGSLPNGTKIMEWSGRCHH